MMCDFLAEHDFGPARPSSTPVRFLQTTALTCRFRGPRAGSFISPRLGWICGSKEANTRGTTPCQTLPRKCTDIHELTSPDPAGEGAELQGRVEVTEEKLLSKGKRKRQGRGAGGGGGQDKKARATPEMEDRWSLSKLSKCLPHSNILCLAEDSQTSRNRRHRFSVKLCPGLDQFPSIIYLSSFLREADSNSVPGVTDVSRCSCEALAGGCWEFSLFVHFNPQRSSPRGALSPPPARAESADVVSTSR